MVADPQGLEQQAGLSPDHAQRLRSSGPKERRRPTMQARVSIIYKRARTSASSRRRDTAELRGEQITLALPITSALPPKGDLRKTC